MQVIRFYEKNKLSLIKLLAILAKGNISFFDVASVTFALEDSEQRQFLTRLYNECVFLNAVYLDYFNYRDQIIDLSEHYNFNTLEECQKFIDLAREVHETIHSKDAA
jgi:hypothetical protein